MTTSLVIDASFTFRLLLPGPQQDRFRSLVAEWVQVGYELCVPILWAYEMTSALCKAVHLGDLTPDEASRTLDLAQALGMRLVAPDRGLMHLALHWTLRLRRAAAYDSFYLALAETLDCQFWTADRRLHHAAGRPWVCLAGDRQESGEASG
jgi:predicted nucleic acid-binding protein